jgi:hypothetical protein
MSEKPRVFIASSSEQLAVAQQIAKALNDPKEWTVVVWDKAFDFSASFIESLERELGRADFAMVVLTGDDVANVRKKAAVLPRDNVIFELGLFIGRLGRDRCFFFVDAASGTRIASDLSGVMAASYYPDTASPDLLRPSLRMRVKGVKEQMRALGIRYKPDAQVLGRQEALWRLSSRVAGHWWERVRYGEDDTSALSYVTMSVNPVTNMPRLEGRSYSRTGERLADWTSLTSGVVFGHKTKIRYSWEGQHEEAIGQSLGGHGVITFDDNLLTAEGYFLDTNFARIQKGAPTRSKHFRLYRCRDEDIKVMHQPFADDALALIKERLSGLN